MLNIFRKKRSPSDEALQELLGAFELQSFPGLIMEVLSDLRNPNESLSKVAGKLEADPGMTVKILRTVNTAGFGVGRQVTSLHTAVSMTGHARLESILLTHGIKGALPAAKAPNFSMKEFWTASSLRACLARGVAKRLHPASQDEAFTAGLLLDMAVPVFVRQRQEDYAKILAAMDEGDSWLHELEADSFSFDHADLGGHMARKWQLPPYLVDAIADHHSDKEADLEPGVRLAALLRQDTSEPALAPVFAMAEAEFGLDEKVMTAILTTAQAEAEEFAGQIV